MGHKAVFLDRDNTLIEDPGYINHPNQVHLLPGAAAALAQLRRMGYLLVVVSNQSGVARGIVTEEVLEKIHRQLNRRLTDEGASLDAIYYCPYHPEGVIPKYRMESELRKPAPGMLLQAAADLDIDLDRSWMIGDTYRDIAAGMRAGCKTILIDSPVTRAARTATDPIPDRKVGSIREAANVIRMMEQNPPKEAPAADEEPRENVRSVTFAERRLLLEEEQEEPQVQPATTAVEVEEETPPTMPDAASVEAPAPEPTPAPMSATAPARQAPPAAEEGEHHTNAILREMLHLLKSRHRQDLYEEFSFARFTAMLLETVALFCLIASLWFWMDSSRPATSAQMLLGYAVFLQLAVIALLLIQKNR